MNAATCRNTLFCGLTLLVFLAGCSNDKDEKGAVEKMSDKVADKAVEQMTKPLDKARDSQALQNAQNQKIEEMAGENGQQPERPQQ
jgi:ABC-type uncharacterized transport system auxiliary subunit